MARTKRTAGRKKATTGAQAAEGAVRPAQVRRLQRELKQARGELELRTTALEAAEARSDGFEQRLRQIQESRPYRMAWRLWRIRTRARAPLSRAGSGRPRSGQDDASEEAELSRGPDESLDATGNAEVFGATPTDAAPSAERDFEQEFHGSRGIRSAGSELIGPPSAVVLLGGQTEDQLREALDLLGSANVGEAEQLIITDCDALRTLDAYGYLYEYIPPREDWTDPVRAPWTPRPAGRAASAAGRCGWRGSRRGVRRSRAGPRSAGPSRRRRRRPTLPGAGAGSRPADRWRRRRGRRPRGPGP